MPENILQAVPAMELDKSESALTPRRGEGAVWASLVPLVVRNPPASAGDTQDTGSIPGPGRCPEEGVATHSRVLAWRSPWTEEPGELQSTGSHRVGHAHSSLGKVTSLQLQNEEAECSDLSKVPSHFMNRSMSCYCNHASPRISTTALFLWHVNMTYPEVNPDVGTTVRFCKAGFS